MAYGTVTAEEINKRSHPRPAASSESSSDDELPRGATTTSPESPPHTVNSHLPETDSEHVTSRGEVWKRSWNRKTTALKHNISEFYQKNIGLVMVFFAQMFASIVSRISLVSTSED